MEAGGDHATLAGQLTCNGAIHLEAYTLYAGAYEYQWTPAGPLDRPDTSITNGFINQTTTFVITARDSTSNCVGSDTVTIQKYPMPDVTIRSDTTILARGEVSLWATGGATYEWTPGYWLNNAHIRDPIANPQAPVTYTVTATNEYGCSDSDSVHINIIEGLQLPTAFTPNGDGRNDVFKLVNYGYEEVIDFSIYNRWGQRVFTTYDGTQGWDGTYNGRPADIGTYYYNIRLRLRNGTEQLFRGDLALLR
jgi:gliding motility-associated-like protein